MLKGGMLLTYTLGIQNRATQDIDFLVKGLTIDTKNPYAKDVGFESVINEIKRLIELIFPTNT